MLHPALPVLDFIFCLPGQINENLAFLTDSLPLSHSLSVVV